MLARLNNIFKYYDSEPLEICLGIIWTIFFPIIWSFKFHFSALLVIPSMLIGVAMIKSSCSSTLRVRKTLAFSSFLFSLIVLLSLFLSNLMMEPALWFWFLPLFMSLINLITMTNKFYHNKENL